MWTDMQKELGDCPEYGDRMLFKSKWCEERVPQEGVNANCFLCEYIYQTKGDCTSCPIDWGKATCQSDGGVDWRYSPISEILALPEREDV